MMRPVFVPGLAALVLGAGQSFVLAGEPSEAVRPFYLHPGLELEPEGRASFIDPARRVLEQNDLIRQTGEEGCLDPALPFDDTEFEPAEVAGTLDLREVVTGELATVVASFRAEGETRRVQWQLRNVGGVWKISDIISMSKDWALSRFQCE
jgi:hypothetical protein